MQNNWLQTYLSNLYKRTTANLLTSGLNFPSPFSNSGTAVMGTGQGGFGTKPSSVPPLSLSVTPSATLQTFPTGVQGGLSAPGGGSPLGPPHASPYGTKPVAKMSELAPRPQDELAKITGREIVGNSGLGSPIKYTFDFEGVKYGIRSIGGDVEYYNLQTGESFQPTFVDPETGVETPLKYKISQSSVNATALMNNTTVEEEMQKLIDMGYTLLGDTLIYNPYGQEEEPPKTWWEQEGYESEWEGKKAHRQTKKQKAKDTAGVHAKNRPASVSLDRSSMTGINSNFGTG